MGCTSFVLPESRHFPTLFYHSLSHSLTLDNKGNEVSYLCNVIRKTSLSFINYQLSFKTQNYGKKRNLFRSTTY